ncbi:MAG: hypothetical protein ACJ8DJ_23265 [Gemmatimonadales bacterium]|jgi:hypothetical protein
MDDISSAPGRTEEGPARHDCGASRATFEPTARFMAGARVPLNGKDYIVVQVGLKDGSADNGRATYVYTP